jgi:isochorismate synthase
MEILDKTTRLYAGGGILHDSDMETEWKETQTKMQTMHRLLNS